MPSKCLVREESLSLTDASTKVSDPPNPDKKQIAKETKLSEHSRLFEDLIHEINEDDEGVETRVAFKKLQRRPSLDAGQDAKDMAAIKGKRRTQRRHSGFESAQRLQHKENHKAMRSYLESTEDQDTVVRRSKLIASLMDFNLSVSLSMASMSDLDSAPSGSMQYSCPVLSYLDDEEEDSIELVVKNRPALASVEEEQPWEKLKDGDTSEESKLDNTYTVQLAPIEEPVEKHPQKRKHSYKILEERLEHETPQEILRNISRCGSIYDLDVVETSMAMMIEPSLSVQPKSLDAEVEARLRHMAFRNSKEVGFNDRRDLSPPRQQLMGVARGA